MSTVTAIAAFVNTALLTAAEAKAQPSRKSRERDFLKYILPAVLRAARNAFRGLPAHVREELEQDASAVAWKEFVRLVSIGYDPLNCVGTIAQRAVLAERRQEHFCGKDHRNDALSYKARQVHGFKVQAIAYLADATNGEESIPDQVAFRIDFAAWRAMWDEMNREVIDDLAEGYRPEEVRDRRRLTKNNLEYRRRRFLQSWQQLQGEVA
jgi:hypothetical protein